MTSAVETVEAYLECLRKGDFTDAPLAPGVRYESPLVGMPVEGKHNMIRFLQTYVKVMDSLDVIRHLTDGEYVATLLETTSRFGKLTVMQLNRVQDGLITEARAFFDPREVLDNMGSHTTP